MPITPLHLGAVLPLKPLLRGRLSISVFLLVQMGIDIEPMWRVLTRGYPLHDHLHTFAGALLVSVVVIIPGKLGTTWVITKLRRAQATRSLPFRRLTQNLRPVTWTGATIGGLFGGVSHVLLDAMIYRDVQPLAPFSAINPFLIPGSFLWVHVASAASAALGMGFWWWWTSRRARRKS